MAVDSQNRLVANAEHRRIIFVPNVLRHINHSVAKLVSRSVGMCVHPLPNRDVEKRHAANFIHTPSGIEHVEASIVGIGIVEAQDLQIFLLEHESQRLGKGSVRHTVEHEIVDVVERDGLLDVMTELVDGDVVALIIHTRSGNARAQMRLLATMLGTPSMPATPRCVDRNALAEPCRTLRAEAKFGENFGQSGINSLRVGIFCARQSAQFVLVHRTASLKAVVPNVVGGKFASQTLGNEFADLLHFGRRQILAEDCFGAFDGDFHIFVEVAVDSGVARVAVDELLGVEVVEQAAVAHVSLRVSLNGLSIERERVGHRIPLIAIAVDNLHGNRLVDDSAHHVVDEPLLFDALGATTVVCLDFVAQIPVAEQTHIRREERFALRREQVAHINIVVGDIDVGGSENV